MEQKILKSKKAPCLELAFIFDVDGVLADNTHRQGLLHQEGKTARQCWKEFFLAGDNDPAYPDTLHLAKALQTYGFKILLLTGRSGEYFTQLENWLMALEFLPDEIYMRSRTDFRKDWEIKEEAYLKLIAPRYKVLGVFEDNTACVKMWRGRGITCYQPREENY